MRRIHCVAGLLALVLLCTVCKKPPVGHPPATPSAPSGITNGCINTSYDFTATTTDPDSDSVCYRFQWGDGATSEWCNWVASGETSTMSHTWTNANTYQVKVQAKDRPDNTSDWSAALAVTISSNSPPNTPATPSGPATARKDSVCTFTAIATDPDGDGVAYRFVWGDGDTSDWTDWGASGWPGVKTHSWGRSGSYAVKTQAKDAGEALSVWSNPLAVAIANPYAPVSSTPDGSSHGVRNETLSFTAFASDAGGDSVSIRFAWGDGDTSAWSALSHSGSYVAASHAWRDTGRYLVRSQASDEDGVTSAWSAAHTTAIAPLKWRYLTGDNVASSPAIDADGNVYVGSRDSYLYAINPDGTLRWRYKTDHYVYSSPAIAPDGTVYVGSYDRYLYAVNSDGSLKWRYQAGGAIESSPAIAGDGTVYVGSGDSCLHAINPNGTRKWRYRLGGSIYKSSPAVAADGTVYVGSGDSCLYAINPNGTFKWRYPTDNYISSSPAVAADGTVYVGSADYYVYAIDQDGSLRWRHKTNYLLWSSPVVAGDGTVYVGSLGGPLYAFDPNGTQRWSRGCGSISSTPAVASNGIIYVAVDSCLQAFDPNGNVRWCCPIDGTVRWSSPAVSADGVVYFGSSEGYLYAIVGDSPLADSPWSKFHHDNKNTGRVGGGR